MEYPTYRNLLVSLSPYPIINYINRSIISSKRPNIYTTILCGMLWHTIHKKTNSFSCSKTLWLPLNTVFYFNQSSKALNDTFVIRKSRCHMAGAPFIRPLRSALPTARLWRVPGAIGTVRQRRRTRNAARRRRAVV